MRTGGKAAREGALPEQEPRVTAHVRLGPVPKRAGPQDGCSEPQAPRKPAGKQGILPLGREPTFPKQLGRDAGPGLPPPSGAPCMVGGERRAGAQEGPAEVADTKERKGEQRGRQLPAGSTAPALLPVSSGAQARGEFSADLPKTLGV